MAKLTVEERYYNRMRERWLRTKKGLYVLIHKKKAVGFYRNVEDAKMNAMLIINREHGDCSPTEGNFIRHPMLICQIRDSF